MGFELGKFGERKRGVNTSKTQRDVSANHTTYLTRGETNYFLHTKQRKKRKSTQFLHRRASSFGRVYKNIGALRGGS